MKRLLASLASLALATGTLAAQAPRPVGPVVDAAATITASDVAERVGVIAHDSMLGRDTPSRGLEMTAKYVADEFRRFGLRPGGDNGTWFQRYPITRRRLQPAQSRVVLKAGATTATARLDATARHVSGDIPRQPVSGPVILVGGPVTPDAVGQMKLRDKVVLYVHDYSRTIPTNATQVARAIRVSGARAIVAVSNLDSAAFAARVPRSGQERYGMELRTGYPPSLEVGESAIAPVLGSAGVKLEEVRR